MLRKIPSSSTIMIEAECASPVVSIMCSVCFLSMYQRRTFVQCLAELFSLASTAVRFRSHPVHVAHAVTSVCTASDSRCSRTPGRQVTDERGRVTRAHRCQCCPLAGVDPDSGMLSDDSGALAIRALSRVVDSLERSVCPRTECDDPLEAGRVQRFRGHRSMMILLSSFPRLVVCYRQAGSHARCLRFGPRNPSQHKEKGSHSWKSNFPVRLRLLLYHAGWL